MHLDDVENETAPRVEQYLSKIKVIRRIAGKIIDFLAQLEDFQKKLWLKKKFVIETQLLHHARPYPGGVLHGDRSPTKLSVRSGSAICNRRDRGRPDNPGYSAPLTMEFLKANPTLVVDTQHFPSEFTARLSRLSAKSTASAMVFSFTAKTSRPLSLLQTTSPRAGRMHLHRSAIQHGRL